MLEVVLILLLVVAVLILVYGYNRIVQLEQRMKKAWSDVDVQLKRIAELIPNLVNTVKGSAAFEKSTLEEIAKAHSELVKNMGTGDIEKEVKAASKFMGVLMPIVYQIPQYPDLKSTQHFQSLMNELTVSIDRLSYARQFYNQTVEEYNTFISQIPWNIIASLMNRKPATYFQVEDASRERIEKSLEEGSITGDLKV